MWTSKLSCILGIFLIASVASAAPANPEWINIEQPDGTKFAAKIHGDEFQKWVEAESGHTVIRNKSTRHWEYAEQDLDGNLKASGMKVAPWQVPPTFIKKGIKPPRNREAAAANAKALRRMYEERAAATAPSSAQFPSDGATGSSLGQTGSSSANGDWTPTPVSGTGKVLMILVNFSDRTLVTTANSWYNRVFDTTPGVKSVANYYHDNSFGALSIAPVSHTQPGNPSGVVTVSVNRVHPDNGTAESTWVTDAINAASAYVDFSSLDANGNGYIDRSEAVVYFIVAGYEESGSYKTPSVWAHATMYYSGGLYAAGKYFPVYAMNGELNNYDVQHPMGVIAHEMGHHLCGLPDLYDTSGNNAGLGHFSLMAGGSWGADSLLGEYSGTTPTALDAWSRSYLGWTTPVVPQDSGTLSIGTALSDSTAALKFINASHSSTEYFLAENRYPVGWDTGLRRLLGSNFSGGLLITHIDITVGTQGYNDINRYSAGMHQGVMAEQASTAFCNMATTACRGSQQTLFYSGNNQAFNDTSVPNSRYYNGSQSDFSLSAISAAGPTMSMVYQGVVAPATDVTLVPNVASPQFVSTQVSFTAAGSGGAGNYEYAFAVSAPGSSVWVIMKAYSALDSWTWNTASLKPGTYKVRVMAKAAGSTPEAGYDVRRELPFQITTPSAASSINLAGDVASPQLVTSVVTFTAAAGGGSGNYEYAFLVKSPGSKSWVKKQDFSSSAAWSWNTTGLRDGTHMIRVLARNAGTKTGTRYDVARDFSYVLIPLPVTTDVNLAAGTTGLLSVTTDVQFTAIGAGGTGSYEYAFLMKTAKAKKWVNKQSFNGDDTWTFSVAGLKPGTYTVRVQAKTAGSAPVSGYDTYRDTTIVVN